MRFANVSDARSIRAIHHGTVGADDVHHAVVAVFFQRAFSHFVRFQKLGVSRGDVTPQSPCGGRTKLRSGARPRVLQEGKYRRCALENVAYGAPVNVKKREDGRGGGGQSDRFYCVFLPVNIISGRQSRSTEPGARLGNDNDADDQPIERAASPSPFDPRVGAPGPNEHAHLSQNPLAFSIFC